MPSLAGLYPAATYVPEGRVAHFGPDRRVRCTTCDKVVFEDEAAADRSAERATLRGTPMRSYVGHCGHWHVTRIRRKR
jgi:uncharacterized protein YlaI